MSKLELRIFQLKETMPERLIGTDCKFVGNPTLVRIQFVSFLRHKSNLCQFKVRTSRKILHVARQLLPKFGSLKFSRKCKF